MSEIEISYWGMIGTWFAGIATLLAVIVSLYLANYVSKVKLSLLGVYDKHQGLELRIFNVSKVYAEIEHIYILEKKASYRGIYYEAVGLELTNWDFEEVNIDKRSLLPNQPQTTFTIDNHTLSLCYNNLLPYKNGLLDKPVKMPKCFVRVFLTNGESFIMKMPLMFYSCYRDQVGCQHNDEMSRLSTEPSKYIAYKDSQQLYKIQQEALNRYSIARNNYHLLFC